jgi:hypothetical protein
MDRSRDEFELLDWPFSVEIRKEDSYFSDAFKGRCAARTEISNHLGSEIERENAFQWSGTALFSR